jgi:hypothetical protein
MTTALKPNPVIFIQGMWIHATAWQPWLELFESRGSRAARRPAVAHRGTENRLTPPAQD